MQKSYSLHEHPVLRILIGATCIIIVFAGLRSASTVLVPFMLAAFISVFCAPVISWLTSKRIPVWSAVTLIVLLLLGFFALFSSLLTASTQELLNNLPLYKNDFNRIFSELSVSLKDSGLAFDKSLTNYFQPSAILSWIGNIFSGLGNILVNFVLIIFIVAFILLEANSFPEKLRKAFHNEKLPAYFSRFILNVKKYLYIKSWISLATGILIGASCWLIGLDFPVLWGLLAFFLNFIPNIGSLLAAVPAIVLALATGGWSLTFYTTVVFVLVNTLIGNLIEPKIMGANMGLSPLIVFSSLILWGWIFGPVGFLLAVPLTMILHIVLESHPDTRWLAVLMGR